MFAKHKLGAACLQDYKDIKSGAIVPTVNELYSQVEKWLESNEWMTLPDDFGVQPKTPEQRIKEIESRLSELDLLSLRPLRAIEAGSATQYDHDKLIELDTESDILRIELRGLAV